MKYSKYSKYYIQKFELYLCLEKHAIFVIKIYFLNYYYFLLRVNKYDRVIKYVVLQLYQFHAHEQGF